MNTLMCETILGRFQVDEPVTSLALHLDAQARLDHARGDTEIYHIRRRLLHNLLGRHGRPAGEPAVAELEVAR